MAVKLDMLKAYDHLKWSFENILRKLGFHEKWISLIMACVTTVKYRVKINEILGDVINSTRRLKQGDQLSPYMFIITAEALPALIKNALQVGKKSRFKFNHNNPCISHLLFVDDVILFTKAETSKVQEIKRILALYERALGRVNLLKIGLICSKSVDPQWREDLA